MNEIVHDKLNDEAYKLLDLPTLEFSYGNIEFFNKETIDNAQKGFRYNALTNEKIDAWVGDDYIVIGYDSVSGSGPDPYIINTADPKLPVYWLMSDGGDWSNPDLICDSLEKFNKIINLLATYKNYFTGSLTQELKDEIISKICEIENSETVNENWDELLNIAMN